MQVSNAANGAPCIRIEQLVKHDVWDIRRKDDGAFVMKKLSGNDPGPSADTATVNINATRTNPEQTGARPKVIVQVPKTNNALTVNASSRPQNVHDVQKDNAVAANPVSAPKIGVIMPERNIITLTPASTQKNSVITINTAPVPPKGVIAANTSAPEKAVHSVNTATSPRKGVITVTANPPKKKDVITISATPSPKREVITINTTPLVKPTVFTINTKKDEGPAGNQVKDNASTAKHSVHDNWNIPKVGNKDCIASTSSSMPSASGSKPDGDIQGSNIPTYTEEVYRIQEMFPQIPLSVISDNLKVNGSVESTIDSLLAQAFQEPVPANEVPPAAPSDDDIVFIKSVKANKPKTDNASSGKKSGSVIKIELLAKNEVWDIKRKNKEGFVLKKLTEEEDKIDEPQCLKLEDSVLCTGDSGVMEEEHDPLLDDIILDGMLPIRNPEQSNAPVKLMVYSQSSNKVSPDTERKVAMPCDNKNLDSAMEIDNCDNCSSTPEETVSVEAFEFSDDENEEGETVEHFLFKASLVLKKFKYRNESEIQAPKDLALLNITGSITNEEKDDSVMDEDPCSDDDDYYTDECYTDEGD